MLLGMLCLCAFEEKRCALIRLNQICQLIFSALMLSFATLVIIINSAHSAAISTTVDFIINHPTNALHC